MYNKNQYRKFNDKKILHKVKKQWVTISLALFMIIGGGTVASNITASANTNSQNQQPKVQIKLTKTKQNKDITTRAKSLHKQLMSNVANYQKSYKQNKHSVNSNKLNNKKRSNRNNINFNKSYVNQQPIRRIKSVNQLKLYQNGLYEGHFYNRVRIPFNSVLIKRTSLLHSNINAIGHKRDYFGALYRGQFVNISRAFREYFNNNSSYINYEIPLAYKRSAFITSNDRFVSYIAPTTNYRYYQRKINYILNHSHNKRFNNIRVSINKLAKRKIKNYRIYMDLYIKAYNTKQALNHPVIFNNKRKGYHDNKHVNNGTVSQSNEVNSLENNTNNNISYAPSDSTESVAPSSMASSFVSASVTPILAPFVPSYVPSVTSSNTNSSVVMPSSASTTDTNNSSNTSSISNASSNVVPNSMASNSSNTSISSVNSKSVSSAISSKTSQSASYQSSSNVVPSSALVKSSSINSSMTSNSSANSKKSNSVMPSSSKASQSSVASYVSSKSTSNDTSSKSSISNNSSSKSSSTNSLHSNSVKSNASNSNLSSNVKPASSESSNNSKTQAINGIYRGLHYSYNPINKFVEFIGGTLDKDSASDFISSSDTPSDIKHSVAVKVDKGVQLGANNNLGHMFESDSDLVSIDLHNWDIHQANNISDMFEGDNNLRTVNLSNVNASGVGFPSDSESALTRGADLMFDGDSSLVSINLNGFKAGDTVSSMFSGIPNIKDLNGIDIRDMDLSKTKHMSDMFESDSDLTNVDLHNWDIHQATNINGMFTNDPNLRTVNLSNVDASGVGFPSDQDMLTAGNADAMFEDDGSLEFVNLKGFKAGDTVSGMFSGIPNIKNLDGIDIRDMDLSRTKYMDDMFESDSDLTNVDLHNWDIRHAVHIESMFANDPNLQTVDLSNVNASGVGIHADNRINQIGHPLSDQDAESLFLDDEKLSNVNFKGFKIWHFLDMLPKSLKGEFDKQLSNTIDNVFGNKYGNHTVEPVTNDLERSILFIPTIIMHTFQSSSHFMNPLRNINIVGCTYDHNIGDTNPKCSPGIYGHMSDISDAIDSDEDSGSRYGSNSFLGLTFTGITYELLNNSSYTDYGAKFDGIISKESIDDIYSTIGDVLDIFFGTSTIPSTIVDSVKSTATKAVTNSIEQQLPYLGKELCKYFGDAKDAKNVAKYTAALNNNIVKENNPESFASSTGESLDDVKSDAKSGIRNNCQGIASIIIPLINKVMHDYYFFD